MSELEKLAYKRELPELAHAFPEETPAEVIELYDTIKSNMRMDAQEAGLLTIDELIIERTAYAYVTMRQREMTLGTAAYSSATDQKNINGLFIQLSKLYLDLVRNAETDHREKVRELAMDMKTIVLDAVEDKEAQRRILHGMADLIERRGFGG